MGYYRMLVHLLPATVSHSLVLKSEDLVAHLSTFLRHAPPVELSHLQSIISLDILS